MAEARPLLIELGLEELPIAAVDGLAAAFANAVCAGLEKRGIAADVARAQVYGTPRRLAVRVPGVAAQQVEQRSEAFGPYLNVALDAAGQPTKALLGFAGKCGVAWTTLERAHDAKGERYAHRSVAPGRATRELIAAIVSEAVAGLPIPKPMRWGRHETGFVRPLHWLVLLHGDELLAGELFGIACGRASRGHRFHHPAAIPLAHADDYVAALAAAKVLVDPAARRQRIRDEVARAAQGLGTPQLDAGLLDELANLTEWPVAMACSFERAFLGVPQAALVTTMRANQKFVPVFDARGSLSEHFIGVANIESRDPAQIRRGYERVIRPRFADAKYFFDADCKTPLADHAQGLHAVVWQQRLGSLGDKTARIAALATRITAQLGAQGLAIDAQTLARAAELSRCDLLTRMVGEFPELQGEMGGHYALHQGEPAAVAHALAQFYRPRHAGDDIAEGALAQCLTIADKLDTLAGIFAVGQKPSGNKDPFALRRAALGLARSCIEGQLDLDLDALLHDADTQVQAGLTLVAGKPPASNTADTATQRVAELREFILDRLRGYYAEQGFSVQAFNAVAAVHPASLFDFDRRLRAVAAFAHQPEAAALAAANKRVANILRKEAIDVAAAAARPLDDALLHEPAERALAQALDAARADNATRLSGRTFDRDYQGALLRLAQLQAPIDAFFESVMVMAEDAALRSNRVALLARIKARFDAVADIAAL